jgi:hypothetical protein
MQRKQEQGIWPISSLTLLVKFLDLLRQDQNRLLKLEQPLELHHHNKIGTRRNEMKKY